MGSVRIYDRLLSARRSLQHEANDVNGNQPLAHVAAFAEVREQTRSFAAVVIAVVDAHSWNPAAGCEINPPLLPYQQGRGKATGGREKCFARTLACYHTIFFNLE